MNSGNKIEKNYLYLDIIEKYMNIPEKNHELQIKPNINEIINFSKKIDYFLQKTNNIHSSKRKIIFFQKYILKQKIKIKYKKNYFNNNKQDKKLLLFIIIPIFRILVDKNDHINIRMFLMVLIKFCICQVFPYELFKTIIELLLNIIVNISNSNSFYTINDEPFSLINDIIIALSKHTKEIKMENIYKNILIDIIDLFDEYLLFNNKYKYIILTETPIWLKLLDNYINTNQNHNESFIKENISPLDLKTKINNLLIKIYKFSLRSEYIENIIIKNGIMDLNFYLNSLDFLKQLFWEEIRLIQISDFKINEGNFIPNNKYIFFNDRIPPTKNEGINIIFSFKILNIVSNKVIEIMEFFDHNMESSLKLYIDQKVSLILELPQNNNKLETNKIIKENVCYLLYISIPKNITKTKTIELFINSNEKTKDNIENYFVFDKISYFNLSQNLSLVLGKNNFFGVIGDFLIINKQLTKNNYMHLFNLTENYAKALRRIYYKLEQLPSTLRQKNKSGYNRSEQYKKAIDFFQKLEFKIIFDISANEIYNMKSNIFLKNIIDNFDLRGYNSDNQENVINTKKDNFFKNEQNIKLFKNISKMKYSYDIFYQNNGIDFLTFQLYNFFSKINDIKILNAFLYENISFIMEIILYADSNYINPNPSNPLLDQEISTFFLVLLNLLINKKGKIFLDNQVIMKLIEISNYFKTNKLIDHKNMILSILLDIDFYENKEDIFHYGQIFDSLKNEFEEQSEITKSIINKEFLYKILMLDFCFKKKKNNHKLLMEIISGFISNERKNIDDTKQDKYDIIHNEFISYFLSLKDEIKIFHYLKILYFNFDKIKSRIIKNIDFITYINPSIEQINSDHCKYCSYNKILLFLIYQEIINLNKNNNDRSFNLSKVNLDRNMNKLFLICFFSQVFCLSFKERFTFIKKNTDDFN